jgi:CIC family chloride channel protein
VSRADGSPPPESVRAPVPSPWTRHRRLVGDTHIGLSPAAFGLAAVLLGIVCGFSAFFFRILIAAIHNLFFLGRMSLQYDTNVHTGSAPWGPAVVFAPVAGSLMVTWLTRTFAPEAKGHGVPEVMDAIFYQKSVIRPAVAAIKSLASALSIGTGGSVGREGPIIQICAAVASFGGGVANVSRWQRATLVAAGGGAGIAATFNTPLGGVLFAVEVLLHEVSVRTLVPVALATTTATYVGRALFGDRPAFPVPALHLSAAAGAWLLPASAALGGLMALVSVAFIRGLYGAEDFFERCLPERPYLRHALGMVAVGATFTCLMAWRGNYYVQGVGYATIMDVLSGNLTGAGFLLLLFVLKLEVTCVTLGSGGSGGIFSPSLFMGATVGAAFGLGFRTVFPGIDVPPEAFALIGMAALVAGATGAALTAIVMLFEMTLDYSVVLPLTFAAAMSYGLRRRLLEESIYTMKLARRGHVMPLALQANAHMVHHVADVAMDTVLALPADSSPLSLELGDRPGAPSHYVVVDDSGIVGVVSRGWALAHRNEMLAARTLGESAQRDFVVVPSDTTIFDLIATLQRARGSVAIVTAADAAPSASQIRGIVTKEHLAEALAEGMELFED